MTLNELNQIRKDSEELGSKVKRLDSVIAELTRLRGLEPSGALEVLYSKPDHWKSITNEIRVLLIDLISSNSTEMIRLIELKLTAEKRQLKFQLTLKEKQLEAYFEDTAG